MESQSVVVIARQDHASLELPVDQLLTVHDRLRLIAFLAGGDVKVKIISANSSLFNAQPPSLSLKDYES